MELNLANLDQIRSKFRLLRSYTATDNSKYAAAATGCVSMKIYPTDKAHSIKSKTYPRTEFHSNTTYREGIKYVYSLEQYLVRYTPNYQFAFMQMFGVNGPNILIRWCRNRYQIVTRSGNTSADASIIPIVGKWVKWRIEFMIGTSKNSYVKLYRDNKLIAQHNGPSSKGGKFSLTFGLYSQNMNPPQDIHIKYRNLKFAAI
jgi:hypothetical protein